MLRLIAPPERTQNTRPSAVSCAEVQPRYEAVIATLVMTSTGLVVALAVVIADGEQIHAVERAREEQGDEDQAERGAEGVGNDAAQAVLGEGGRDGEHRFGAEPGGEHGGRAHVQRQAATRDYVILGVVHALCGPQPDSYGDEQVGGDRCDQHARAIIASQPVRENPQDHRDQGHQGLQQAVAARL